MSPVVLRTVIVVLGSWPATLGVQPALTHPRPYSEPASQVLPDPTHRPGPRTALTGTNLDPDTPGRPDPTPSERLVQLSDPADPRVADYTSLTDVSLRRKLEPERGLYLAGALRRARTRQATLLLHGGESGWTGSVTCWSPQAVRVRGHGRGARADHRLPPAPRGDGRDAPACAPLPLESVLASARRVAILEDIVDHTNVGAIFRSAAALDVDAVLVTPRCADPRTASRAGVHGHRVPGAVGAPGALDRGPAAGQGRRVPHRGAGPERGRRHGGRPGCGAAGEAGALSCTRARAWALPPCTTRPATWSFR